jgi:hypothetical protein
MNRYSYALNDPVNLTDPDGRFVCGTACDDPPSPSGTGNSGGSGTGGASDLFEVEAPSPTGKEVAGGGSPGVNFDIKAFYDAYTKAINEFFDRLKSKEKCRNFFGGWSGVDAIGNFLDEGRMRPDTVTSLGDTGGYVVGTGLEQGFIYLNGDKNGPFVSPSDAALQRWRADFSRPGLSKENMRGIEVAHEFGHLMRPDVILPDRGNPQQQRLNTQAVIDNCW